MAEAEQSISLLGAEPRGVLRLSAPMSFGSLNLSALLPSFLQRYPQVSIELDLSDRTVDLLGQSYDMAVRIDTRVNNGELVRDAAIAGLGLAMLPTFIVGAALESGSLVRVMEAYQLPSAKVFAVYPQHR